MNHYDSLDLKLYKEGLLNEKLKEKIQDHIYKCDLCLDNYLKLIEEEDYGLDESYNRKILEAINKEKIIRPRKKFSKGDLIFYYGAVASVTVFLTLTGSFSKVVRATGTLDIRPEIGISLTEKIGDFSNKMTLKTGDLINNLQVNKGVVEIEEKK